MLAFMHKAAKVTDDIMTCFAVGLGLPEDYYKEVTCRVAHVNIHVRTPCANVELASQGCKAEQGVCIPAMPQGWTQAWQLICRAMMCLQAYMTSSYWKYELCVMACYTVHGSQ